MTLHIAPKLALPVEAITETFAWLATRGAGKTYSAKVVAEEYLKAGLHVVVLDPMDAWWGLRSSADGKGPGYEIAIFGGEHADMPLEPTAGKFIANLIVEERLSAIVCVSDFSKSKRKEFVADFAEELYRRNREAMHLFMEEADMFAPQKPRDGEQRMLGAIEDIVRRGRGRGIGTTLITQRNAVINKDVIELTSNLIAMRTMGVNDRKTVDAWLDAHGSSEERKDIIKSLPSLGTGEAFFYSPHFMGGLWRIKFRKAETFDSSATPKPGQSLRKPKTVADIDLAVLQERMAETIERTKAVDPKHLRQRIAQLERELKTRPAEQVVKEVPVEVPVALLEPAEAQRIETVLSDIQNATEKLGRLSDDFSDRLARVSQAPKPTPRAERPVPRPMPQRQVARPVVESDGTVTGPQQKILNALAWWESISIDRPTRLQVAALAGYSANSGGYNNLLGQLRTTGRIDYPTTGVVCLTEEGRGMAEAPATPLTTAELHDAVLARLTKPQQRIIVPLIDIYPNAMSKPELGEATGYSHNSGGFNNLLGQLRSLGFIDYPQKGYVAVKEVLFID